MPKLYDEDLSDVVLPDQGMTWEALKELSQDERGRYIRAAREHGRFCWQPKGILPKPANNDSAQTGKASGAAESAEAGANTDAASAMASKSPSRGWKKSFEPGGRWGVFARVYDDIIKNSLLPQPAFALASTLALLSALVGPKFMISELAALRLNLNCVMVGPTGSGKDSPQKRVKELLDSVSMLPIWIDRIGSYQGLEDKMFSRPHRFVVSDEGHKLFAAMADKSSHQAGILDTVLQLYSASNSVFIERALAEEKMSRAQRAAMQAAQAASVPGTASGAAPGAAGIPGAAIPTAAAELRRIDNPYLTVLLATTQGAVEAAMNAKNAQVGLFGRFLFFPSDDRDVDMQFVVTEPPGDLLGMFKTMCGTASAKSCSIGMTDDVRGVYRNDIIRKRVREWAKTQRNPELAEDVCARLQENTFKIAALLAVLDWAERRAQRMQETGTVADDGVVLPPLIGGAEFAYALDLAWWCSTRFGMFVSDAIADADPSERNPMIKIRRFLRRQKGNTDDGWCNVRSVYKASNLTSKVAHENLSDMIANGEADERLVSIKGQSVAQVRLRLE